ncbi:UDP-N-acetylmuramoyl-L-alanyl-D-glutamate--2,6-diaminopimelate ligase, partial [Frankia sp. AiPs1]|uniref:UDP-N-acetylmuramoyl-L-alanyl-D-glutamate--2, 6-diaminopimelate ligase n=1 Tax=Frankia sp. AiPs1 TaxID=573493 RepID=UPI002043E746
LPVLVSADPRRDLAPVAARIHGDPSAALRLLGVTGTNGKTTTAFLLDAGLRAAGHTTGLIGTVETRIAGDRLASAHTTPEASDLQALLATMVERGVDAATMEVSSHALAQHRADALHFAGALFTNLSQDHLDFHPTMADYFEAKASLFEPGRAAVAVIGVGDEWGRRLAARRPDAVTFAVDGPADWTARDVSAGPTGSELLAAGPGGERVELSVPLPGMFNIANALGALALLVAVGVDPAAAAAGIGALPGVPGRMERVEAGQPFLALVDFAHTPDAVTTLLTTVRPLVKGRIIVVLGCGGDRDRGKRPLMGAAAATLADLAILTNDNPRSENPADILAAMLAGVPAGARAAGRVLVEPDRA